ncbi:uncharacterized protein PAC_07022 [Phialocephala subalpina]|uniref:N-acetyltransferase domain-containing protein n=1 Tax=Phialocephala subalpina TaxID=576137 RepID=A0A1L7WWK8_9HELO|nr:uncharacterized protein PAC_07022 [Phialocephala subalpina]
MATSASTTTNISLLLAVLEDIPTLAAVSHAAFLSDKHTRLKALCAGYNHGEGSKGALESYISSPRCVVIKAVTGEGEIVGSVCWSFRGFEWDGQSPALGQNSAQNIEGKKHEQKKKQALTNAPVTQLPPPPQVSLNGTKIQQLAQLSGGAMSHYSTLLTPPDAKCVILMLIPIWGINILPTHQSLGIGSRLISFGTSIADKEGVYSWVSSSDKGYRAFEKAGYREVGRLQLDLDDFAFDGEGKRVLDGESEDGKWGVYVWRYMRREVGG